MSSTSIWSHQDGQQPQAAEKSGFTVADEAYNYFVLPMGAIMSLLMSSIVLQRVKANVKLGPVSRTSTAIGADRLYNSLLYVLSTVEVATYTVMVLFLPVLWFCPSVGVVIRSDTPPPLEQPNKLTTALAILNVMLLVSLLRLTVFWHGVIAYYLYALIARDEPHHVLQARLPTVVFLCLGLTVVMMAVDLTGMLCAHAAIAMVVNTSCIFILMFVLVSYTYIATVLSLLRHESLPQSVRMFRDRVLLICTYLLPFIALWTAKTSIEALRKTDPHRDPHVSEWFHYTACGMTAYMGAFDSFVMGGLCRRLGWARCCCPRPRSHHRNGHHVHNQHHLGAHRQIEDSRIRFGQSLLEGSSSEGKGDSLTLTSSGGGEKKEGGEEDMWWTKLELGTLKSTAEGVEQGKTADVLTTMRTVL